MAIFREQGSLGEIICTAWDPTFLGERQLRRGEQNELPQLPLLLIRILESSQ